MPPTKARPEAATSSGLFTGVFSLFAREFESFVTNATGGLHEEEEGLSSPQWRPKKMSNSTNKVPSGLAPLNTSVPQSTRTSDTTPSPTRQNFIPARRKRRKLSPDESSKANQDRGMPIASSSSHPVPSTSSVPFPSLPSALRRRMSVTMPGSLYPRSPSIEPDFDQPEPTAERHVRFATDSPNEDDSQTTPRQSPLAKASPRRTIAPVVKAVLDKFGDNGADASMLLPNPNVSPLRTSAVSGRSIQQSRQASSSTPPPPPPFHEDTHPREEIDLLQHSNNLDDSQVRGKEQELRIAQELQQMNERRWERDKGGDPHQGHGEEVEKERQQDKERIRALEDEIERLRAELSRRAGSVVSAQSHLVPPPPPPPPPPPSSLTIHLPVQASPASFFVSARASLRHAPSPKEAPINPRTRSRQVQPTVGKSQDMTALLNELKTKQLRRKTGRLAESTAASGSQETFSQSLPASFRGGRGSAFSVSETSSSSSSSKEMTPPSGGFGISEMRPPTLSMQPKGHGFGNQSSDRLGRLQGGLKRKRTDTFGSSSEDIERESTHNDLGSRLHLLTSSYKHPLSFSPPLSTWQPPLTLNDLTTPSLCSDNSLEREDESQHEEPPPTPPLEPSQEPLPHPVPVQPQPRIQPEIIDVDAFIEEQAQVVASSSAVPIAPPAPVSYPVLPKLDATALFAKRQPNSPLPAPSPRKPLPPSRAMRVPIHSQGRYSDATDDPLLIGVTVFDDTRNHLREQHSLDEQVGVETSQQREPSSGKDMSSRIARDKSRIPQLSRQPHSARARGRQSATSASSTKSIPRPPPPRRQPTLDEELRSSVQQGRSSPIGLDSTGDNHDSEVGVLSTSGTRASESGFLAYGGGGGAPMVLDLRTVQKTKVTSRRGTSQASSPGLVAGSVAKTVDRVPDQSNTSIRATTQSSVVEDDDDDDEEEYEPPPLVRRLRMSPTPMRRRPTS